MGQYSDLFANIGQTLGKTTSSVLQHHEENARRNAPASELEQWIAAVASQRIGAREASVYARAGVPVESILGRAGGVEMRPDQPTPPDYLRRPDEGGGLGVVQSIQNAGMPQQGPQPGAGQAQAPHPLLIPSQPRQQAPRPAQAEGGLSSFGPAPVRTRGDFETLMGSIGNIPTVAQPARRGAEDYLAEIAARETARAAGREDAQEHDRTERQKDRDLREQLGLASNALRKRFGELSANLAKDRLSNADLTSLDKELNRLIGAQAQLRSSNNGIFPSVEVEAAEYDAAINDLRQRVNERRRQVPKGNQDGSKQPAAAPAPATTVAAPAATNFRADGKQQIVNPSTGKIGWAIPGSKLPPGFGFVY